jgi:protein TonB
MPTELLPTREESATAEKVGSGFVLALLLHGIVIAALLGAAFLARRSNIHFGQNDPLAGAMQVTAVSSLPLPPRQRYEENKVLTSDKPSIAPTPPAPAPPEPKAKAAPPKADPPPRPNEVLIPTKTKAEPPKPTPSKPADKPAAASRPAETPAPPSRTPPAPPTPKATTGETSGIQIPQSVLQAKTGTSAVAIEERSFGDRFAYYVKLINQAILRAKQQEPDGPETRGKRTVLKFSVDRDGAPSDVEVTARSGSPALDLATQRAIQRIDSFGPLPAGYSHITVDVGYTSQ